jgi:hypothetical protein
MINTRIPCCGCAIDTIIRQLEHLIIFQNGTCNNSHTQLKNCWNKCPIYAISLTIKKRENYLSAPLMFHVTQVQSYLSYPNENQDPSTAWDSIKSQPIFEKNESTTSRKSLKDLLIKLYS